MALGLPAYPSTVLEENLARPDRLLDICDDGPAGIAVITRKVGEAGDAREVVWQRYDYAFATMALAVAFGTTVPYSP